jgi:predicted nucleotidyltransferase
MPLLEYNAWVWYVAMRRDDVIARLQEAEPASRARGIRRAAVFGSIARGDDHPDSDIDILVEFGPGAEGTIYEYVRLKEFIASLFNGPVDVIDRTAIVTRACATSWHGRNHHDFNEHPGSPKTGREASPRRRICRINPIVPNRIVIFEQTHVSDPDLGAQ